MVKDWSNGGIMIKQKGICRIDVRLCINATGECCILKINDKKISSCWCVTNGQHQTVSLVEIIELQILDIVSVYNMGHGSSLALLNNITITLMN